ncbi:type II secretion system protein N [Curvibacter sp. HBC61]|uniref:Type II secretion system protein N n=1 Tax=Curvibacter cyanobacteriorum TaxID=3026422 RepID=A0ABT5MYI2_9BURK|nr:type II secretion system protein N [Curvibacter sp. HBC61]MDD0839065.1 type II secretion system protein N [Curvibacter sp. HBC61]
MRLLPARSPQPRAAALQAALLPRARGPQEARLGRRWAWAGALCGALLCAGFWAPARWLAAAVDQASQGQVQLLWPRGTVWSGSAQWVLTGGRDSQDRTTLPGRIGWRLAPHWNGLGITLALDCCAEAPLQALLQPGWNRLSVQVQDHQSHWPAQLLSGLGTPWNTLQPEGRLQLQLSGLRLDWAAGRLRLEGQAQLDLLDMASRLSTLRPMGSYRVVVKGGDSPSLDLSTLEGSLLLSGHGQWVGARLRFQGTGEAAPEREAALNNLLNLIGRRRGARSHITLG